MSVIEHRSAEVRHPTTTWSVISVEAWERFSFYGMQAILVYYLYASATDGGLGLSQTDATALVGAYGAFVYLMTFVGGWLSDRVLGPERTLLSGALLLVVGHLTLGAVGGNVGTTLGLLAIALGSGAVKTAAITTLGLVYPVGSPLRASGFQFFYAAIQVAALGGPLLTGWLAQRYSFAAGFAAAAVLMIIGALIYLALRPRMIPLPRPSREVSGARLATLAGVAVLAVAAAWAAFAVGVVDLHHAATILLLITVAAAVVLLATMYRSADVTAAERSRMTAYLPLFVSACLFWAVANQIYGVLSVYGEQRVDRTIGDWTIPAAWTPALNPIAVIVMAALVAWVSSRRGLPRPAVMMPAGVVIAGLGMFVLLPFQDSTPYLALVASVAVVALGEVFVGPVSMETTTAHAPAAYRTRFSALCFLAMAIGSSLAGSMSVLFTPGNEIRYFLLVGLGAVVLGAGTLLLTRRFSGR